jgi:DHA2 family multidrug resistance protein
MAAGLLTVAFGNYWMSQMNLDISPKFIIWPRVVVICGLSMIFAPLNVAAFQTIPAELRGGAVGLLALLRNEGGSVGTSTGQIIQERREQFHTLRLNEQLDPLNPAVNDLFQRGQSFFMQQTGDPVASREITLKALELSRDQQASALAYFDVFFILAVTAACLTLLVFLMRRSVAEKGAHVAAE